MMNELCIPIPFFKENQIAEVAVTINGKRREYHFRVESFPWDTSSELPEDIDKYGETTMKVRQLKNAIENYNNGWEIVQIYTPSPGSSHIQVLFRQKKRVE
jgi:hypothetical protein